MRERWKHSGWVRSRRSISHSKGSIVKGKSYFWQHTHSAHIQSCIREAGGAKESAESIISTPAADDAKENARLVTIYRKEATCIFTSCELYMYWLKIAARVRGQAAFLFLSPPFAPIFRSFSCAMSLGPITFMPPNKTLTSQSYLIDRRGEEGKQPRN